jgi:hypothetical protein
MLRKIINANRFAIRRACSLFFGTVLFSLLIVGCKKDNEGNSDDDPATGSAKVIVMDTKTVDASLDSISQIDGTLYFTDLAEANTFNAGSIICSAPASAAPYGFLYKIKNVRHDGNRTVIATEETSLEEAIEDIDFATSVNLNDKIIGIYDEEGHLLEHQVAQTRGTQSLSIEISTEDDDKEGKGKLSVSGELTLSNDLQFEVDISNHKLQYLRFAYKVASSLTVTASGELTFKGKFLDKRILFIRLVPLTIMVGAVPVVITPEIPLHLKCDLNGKIKGVVEITNDCSATVGVLYRNDKLEKVFETNSHTTPIDSAFKFVLSGEFKLTLEPTCSFLLYNSRDISLGAGLGVYGKATLSSEINGLALISRYGLNPELKFTVGAEVNVYAKLKFFKLLKLLDVSATGTIFEVDCWRVSVFPQFENAIIDNVTPNSANVSISLKPSSALTAIYFVSEYGIVVSKNSLPNLEDATNIYSAGALPAVITEYNLPVASAQAGGFEPNTTYYVCPYFKNVFGDFYGHVQNFTTGEYRWHIDADINYKGLVEHYSSDVFLDNYPKAESGPARLPNFRYTQLTWNNPWRPTWGSDFRFTNADPPADYSDLSALAGVTVDAVYMGCKLPTEIGESNRGGIQIWYDCWFGGCYSEIGSFTLTRVE